MLTRLRLFACVAGNDYYHTRRIGPERAKAIALPRGATPSMEEIAVSVVGATNRQARKEDVLAGLKTSVDMYCHPVVWNPETNTRQHLSGIASCPAITSNTGMLY